MVQFSKSRSHVWILFPLVPKIHAHRPPPIAQSPHWEWSSARPRNDQPACCSSKWNLIGFWFCKSFSQSFPVYAALRIDVYIAMSWIHTVYVDIETYTPTYTYMYSEDCTAKVSDCLHDPCSRNFALGISMQYPFPSLRLLAKARTWASR